jgi:zona occludens toxin
MAVRLFTGQPGHGKTQRALKEAMKFKDEGRAVYIGNVKGIDLEATGFIALERFEDWESLPDGSVVVWDECYDAIKPRGSSAKVPQYIEKLATHRHRGFDFILIAQQTKQLDGFVSGLIEQHWHFRRKFGTSVVRIKKWDQWQRDTLKAKAMVTETWKLDPSLWKLYTSATVHTVKKSVPWYYFALPVACIAIVLALWGIPTSLLSRAEAQRAQSDGSSLVSQAVNGTAPGRSRAKELRQTDPAALFIPRLDGMPWTAPAYDEVPLQPPPRLACISSLGSCTCITVDQGTRYPVKYAMCRHIARHGQYDPTYNAGPKQMQAAKPPAQAQPQRIGRGP